MTNPRDAWLAWQAEIGTEDVILAAPWKRPRPAVRAVAQDDASETRAPSGISDGMPQEAVRGEPRATGDKFFRNIAEQLAAPAQATSRPKKSATAQAPPPPPSPAPLPEFQDTEAYRTWLAETWPQWFPATSGALVHAEGHANPTLALVELYPENGALFSGEPGVLLDKMMKAIGLGRDALYLTALMKTPPSGRAWARKDTARMVPVLLRELHLAGCEFVLLLGEACAQAVLRTGRGIPALEGSASVSDGITFAATWHPVDLLRDESLKKPAWSQLQWVQARLPKRGS